MKLDVLITKYLDGELTLQEDAELREYIAEYPEAKEQFQEALDVHVALKDDATTTVLPPELATATEESVLMQILGELPDQPTEEEKKKRPIALWWTLPTAAVLTSIVGFVIGTDVFDTPVAERASFVQDFRGIELEMPIPSEEEHAQLLTEASSIVHARTNTASAPQLRESLTSAAMASNERDDAEQSVFALADASGVAPVDMASYDEMSFAAIESESSFEGSHPEFAAMPADVSGGGGYVTRSAHEERVNVNSQLVSDVASIVSTSLPISLTTTVGTELASNAADNGAVFSFASQSLAYGISDAGKVGLEAGHFSYAFNTSERVYIPQGNFQPITPPVPSKGGDQINVLDHASEFLGSNGGQFVNLMSTNQHSSVFGAVFYEHRLYNAETFHFTTRLGLGGSSDGLLTYFRAGTGYDISGTVSLNVGVDTRYLELRVSQKTATQTNHIGVSLFGALNITI